MTAEALYREGKLDEAVDALGVALRADPTDLRRRTFLFELLCFAGDYPRAERQLDVIAQGGARAELWAGVYRGALGAERARQEAFARGRLTADAAAPAVSGTLNGRPFGSLADADPRVGARLELLVRGEYACVPLARLASVRVEAPRQLRDLLWAPATVRAGGGAGDAELGRVMLPALAPLSWRHASAEVRLGRVTAWEGADDEPAPVGQKLLLVDGEEFPFLELPELEITAAPAGRA